MYHFRTSHLLQAFSGAAIFEFSYKVIVQLTSDVLATAMFLVVFAIPCSMGVAGWDSWGPRTDNPGTNFFMKDGEGVYNV